MEVESNVLVEKRVWTNRDAGVPTATLQQKLVVPVMGHVAANHITRQFGLVIVAICGRATTFPVHEDYAKCCTTSPFQTFSAQITHWGLQPAYDGKVHGKHTVLPTKEPLEQCKLPVFPTFREELKIPKIVIDSWGNHCQTRGVDPDLFGITGGTITLNRQFLQACAYFATDTVLWGEKNKPMKYVPMELRDKKDLPARIANVESGRGRGRPRKSHIAIDLEANETLL